MTTELSMHMSTVSIFSIIKSVSDDTNVVERVLCCSMLIVKKGS